MLNRASPESLYLRSHAGLTHKLRQFQLPHFAEAYSPYLRLGCRRFCNCESTRLQQRSINFNKRLQKIQPKSLKNNKNP